MGSLNRDIVVMLLLLALLLAIFWLLYGAPHWQMVGAHQVAHGHRWPIVKGHGPHLRLEVITREQISLNQS